MPSPLTVRPGHSPLYRVPALSYRYRLHRPAHLPDGCKRGTYNCVQGNLAHSDRTRVRNIRRSRPCRRRAASAQIGQWGCYLAKQFGGQTSATVAEPDEQQRIDRCVLERPSRTFGAREGAVAGTDWPVPGSRPSWSAPTATPVAADSSCPGSRKPLTRPCVGAGPAGGVRDRAARPSHLGLPWCRAAPSATCATTSRSPNPRRS